MARRLASLDLISHGRAGWNVVTSGDSGTAGNYSLDEHYDYATRYGRALEHVTVARGLWDSYEDDAFPRDKEAGVFFDPTRQHALNHRGEYFSVVGPLNIERSAQGHPVIFQAGDSEDGRTLGAAVGEGIFTFAADLATGQAFYREMKERAATAGRDPDTVLIMPASAGAHRGHRRGGLGDEERILQAKDFDQDAGRVRPAVRLARLLAVRPRRPVPGRRTVRRQQFPDSGRTHRRDRPGTQPDACARPSCTSNGSTAHRSSAQPQTVAGEIERWFDGRAADGFILMITAPSMLARFIDEVLPDPAGAGPVPHGVRGDHAARQPRPADSRERPHRRSPGRPGARLRDPVTP